ncbi:MAG: hypothetical protein NTV93_00800 [Verrucomicrobia bacterium]|nr:hypothetical protein [Verrucomicrobiota bacterium]
MAHKDRPAIQDSWRDGQRENRFFPLSGADWYCESQPHADLPKNHPRTGNLTHQNPRRGGRVTSLGGQLWPAKFRVGVMWIPPLSAAPWAMEKQPLPNILKVPLDFLFNR